MEVPKLFAILHKKVLALAIILDIQHLCKSYGNQIALNDIDIKVEQGSVFGLLGPNGAGKTTLIRIINQIIEQDKGEIFFKGEPLSPDHVSRIGYLPEERGLYKKMTVLDQLLYFARLKGLSTSDSKSKVRYWLEKLDIRSWADKRIDELSKGMAQKVQFIATVIHEPVLLILDEPFSGFDPVNAEIIKNEILELKARGTTLILSTHRMESVELLCDDIAMIYRSQKILDGNLHEIRQRFRPDHYQVKLKPNSEQYPEYLGMPDKFGLLSFSVGIEDKSPNQILAELMAYGEILEFTQQLPSMQEIFIQQVNAFSHG